MEYIYIVEVIFFFMVWENPIWGNLSFVYESSHLTNVLIGTWPLASLFDQIINVLEQKPGSFVVQISFKLLAQQHVCFDNIFIYQEPSLKTVPGDYYFDGVC